MTQRSRVGVVLVVLALLGGFLTAMTADANVLRPPPASSSTGSVGASAGDGSFGEHADTPSGGDRKDNGGVGGRGHHPVQLWVMTTKDCGPRVLNGHQHREEAISDDPCATVQDACGVPSKRALPKDPHATTVAVIKTWVSGPNKGARTVTKNCNATTAVPHVTPLMAKEEIEKQVPKPTVGLAPPGGRTLVNEQTVMWVDTVADRDLDTVTLLGMYRVALRIHVHSVSWTFGDGDSDVTDGPGTPYRAGEHCKTATCPGHFGHTYASTGSMTIRAQVVWSGQFSVNGGAWQDIDGTVTGPEQAAGVVVVEGRGVLVPDPTPR
jgi:hypothetical protein